MLDFSVDDIRRIMTPGNYFESACVRIIRKALEGKTEVFIRGKPRDLDSLSRHFNVYGFRVARDNRELEVSWKL